MNKKPTKINLTSDDSLFEKSLNLQKYIEDLSSQAINLTDKFSFSWAGKSNAIKSVLVPSKLTLNPEPKQSIKWDESENLFIEGDNLEVLKLLQKAYFEKVKMIYIDPPYNTGHDFVYNDDFSAPLDNYLKQTGQKTEGGESTTTNKETNGRYHSDWLSMMYPRLKLAWNLLREDGVIFVSIDDNEVHHLRMIMDEVFGEENFVQNFMWLHGKGKKDKNSRTLQQYILCYAKNKNILSEWSILRGKNYIFENPDNDPNGPWFSGSMSFSEDRSNKNHVNFFKIVSPSGVVWERQWQHSKDEVEEFIKNNRVYWGTSPNYENVPRLKIRPTDEEEIIPENILSDLGTTKSAENYLEEIMGAKVFSYPKPVELIEHLIQLATNNDTNDIIIDFFAGSGTTAEAVMNSNKNNGNRKWICVQLPEFLDETKAKNSQEKQIIKNAISFLLSRKMPTNLAQLCKERIKIVNNKQTKDIQLSSSGFKVFTLSESNYPENNFVLDPEKSQEENQKSFIDYLNKAKQSQLFDKENDASLVYENIVKEGFSLNSKVEKVSIGKNNVYQVTDGERQLLICLENKLASETVKELTNKSHKGKLFICLESSLDDTTAANLSLNLDLKTI